MWTEASTMKPKRPPDESVETDVTEASTDDAQGSGPPTKPKGLTETEPALDAQGQVITDANGQVFLVAKVVQIVTNSPSATIEEIADRRMGHHDGRGCKAGVRRVQEWTTIAFAVQNVDRWARTAP